MKQRRIGPFSVSSIGLGCMNLSHAYGTPPPFDDAERLLLRALDLGVTLFDTAALYGFGVNEELVGKVLAKHRSRFTLASKGGLHGADGKRVVDGRPKTLKWSCEQSLARLKTEVIDLYYLHRWDKTVPIEESVGAMGELVREGKVRAIGLSEVRAETIRKAHAEFPITAVQTEYSLWTRNPEIAVLATCKDIGAAFVPFSPLGRAFLTGKLEDVSTLGERDIRKTMPRFQRENYAANLELLTPFQRIADRVGCTKAQLALSWLLAKGDDIVPIPGTRSIAYLEENLGADDVTLPAGTVAELDDLFKPGVIKGNRYDAAAQAGVDTENFA